ncbi:hypothetical protein K440DRAFT_661644 [Wilcoxina mikolae CBS 423.85]|nr:hypothetical protein K440DRAFT_661644 [Wilcoxina mikolae CBS 423.85]
MNYCDTTQDRHDPLRGCQILVPQQQANSFEPGEPQNDIIHGDMLQVDEHLMREENYPSTIQENMVPDQYQQQAVSEEYRISDEYNNLTPFYGTERVNSYCDGFPQRPDGRNDNWRGYAKQDSIYDSNASGFGRDSHQAPQILRDRRTRVGTAPPQGTIPDIAVHLAPPETKSDMTSPHSYDQPVYTPPDSPGSSIPEYGSSIPEYANPYYNTRPARSADGHLAIAPQHGAGVVPQPSCSGSQQMSTAYSTHDRYHLVSRGQYDTRRQVYNTPPTTPGTNRRQMDSNTTAPVDNPNLSSSVDSFYAQNIRLSPSLSPSRDRSPATPHLCDHPPDPPAPPRMIPPSFEIPTNSTSYGYTQRSNEPKLDPNHYCPTCERYIKGIGRHMKEIHGSPKKHNCPVRGCSRQGEKGFPRNHNLQVHIKNVHKGNVNPLGD